jgi:hypothetical protein
MGIWEDYWAGMVRSAEEAQAVRDAIERYKETIDDQGGLVLAYLGPMGDYVGFSRRETDALLFLRWVFSREYVDVFGTRGRGMKYREGEEGGDA